MNLVKTTHCLSIKSFPMLVEKFGVKPLLLGELGHSQGNNRSVEVVASFQLTEAKESAVRALILCAPQMPPSDLPTFDKNPDSGIKYFSKAFCFRSGNLPYTLSGDLKCRTFSSQGTVRI